MPSNCGAFGNNGIENSPNPTPPEQSFFQEVLQQYPINPIKCNFQNETERRLDEQYQTRGLFKYSNEYHQEFIIPNSIVKSYTNNVDDLYLEPLSQIPIFSKNEGVNMKQTHILSQI